MNKVRKVKSDITWNMKYGKAYLNYADICSLHIRTDTNHLVGQTALINPKKISELLSTRQNSTYGHIPIWKLQIYLRK